MPAYDISEVPSLPRFFGGRCLRDCPLALQIWMESNLPLSPNFFQFTLLEWLEFMVNHRRNAAFLTHLWWIWRWRNNTVFEQGVWTLVQVKRFISIGLQDIDTLSSNSVLLQNPGMISSWENPPTGWNKLNVDGSCTAASLCSTGGVVRDSMGSWILGFMSRVGHGDPLLAEL